MWFAPRVALIGCVLLVAMPTDGNADERQVPIENTEFKISRTDHRIARAVISVPRLPSHTVRLKPPR